MKDLTEFVELAKGEAQQAAEDCFANLARQYGPEASAAAMRTVIARLQRPSTEPAERLIVREYWRFVGQAKAPPSRNGRTGRFDADAQSQDEFIRQYGEYLSDRRQDIDTRIEQVRKKHQRNKKALQRLLGKYPEECPAPAEGHK